MERDDEKKNLLVKNLQLIDISSEDDFLIASPFYDSLEDLRLSVQLDNTNVHDGVKPFGNSNSLEIKNAVEKLHQRVKPRPSFLRKSLAWDSAFFTSAGVLDPDELFIINKGFNKAEAHLLPGIQEDLRVRKSADSESTLDSNGFYLESLEGDPFEDIRASIHKFDKISNVSGFGTAGIQKGLCKELRILPSAKKVDVGSRNRVKPMPASKRRNTKLQGSERIKKEAVVQPQIVQHTARSGESNFPSLKPHKILGRVNPISARQTTKRASLVAHNVKTGSKTTNTRFGRNLTMPKKFGLGDSCNPTTTTTPPPMLSSKVSLTATKDCTVSCSSYDTSSSASSSKYSLNSTRRKLDSRNTKLASSSFPIHLSLISNHSSTTSPASSTDGWSSESLLSTPIANQRYNNLEPSHLQDQSFACQEIDKTRLTSQCAEKALRATCHVSAESTRNFKPSRLRMPSPKIGFFDEDKSMLPKVKEGVVEFHFGAQRALPNSDGATNTKRLSKLRPTNSKVQTDLSPAMDRENCSKTRKVGGGEHDRRKVGLSSSLKAEGTRTKGILKNKMGIENKGQKDDTGAINQFKKKHEETRWHNLGNGLHFLDENDKENLSDFEDQVNGLSRYIEAIDVNKDMVIELMGNPSDSRLSRPSPLCLPTTIGLMDSTRTPLSDKTSVWNRSGSFRSSMEPMQEKPVETAL